MSNLGPYLAYKDSGVEWLRQVPEHWEVRRTSAFCRLQNRDVRETDRTVTAFRDGQVTLRSKRRTDGFTEALQEIGYQGVREGDLVIHSMDGFAGAIGVSDSDGKMSPVAHLYQVELGEARYYAFLLRVAAQSGFIESLAKGIRERSTSFDRPTFKTMLLPVPPGSEQVEILDFLDRETAEIDEFVAESEKLITLLNERRAAVITQAVTKGLDPTVPMKDTGIEWLGQIPAHWSAPEIRRFYALQIGKMLNESMFSGEPAPYVRAGNIQDFGLDLSEVKMLPVTEAEKMSLAIRAGDVLFVEGGAGYGRSDYMEEDLEGWVFQNHVIRIRPRAGASVTGRYLDFWLRFLRTQGHYEALSAFATIPNVSADKLGQIEMTFPPLEEQLKIVTHITAQTAKIDEAIATAREAIALAKERRQALISAAVTGKIDVRSAP